MPDKTWKIIVPNDYFVDKKNYTIDGKEYARVTRILGVIAKHGLASWYMKVGKVKAKQIIEKRQVIGTKVHKLFELTLKKEEYDLDKYEYEIKTDVELFIPFSKNTGLKAEALEQKLWSNKYRYAGTADYIGKYASCEEYLIRGHAPVFEKSSLVIGDWKTSKAIYKDYWLQLAAYAFAFYELTGIKVAGAFIAQFRDGKVKVDEKTWDELVELFNVFKATLTLYKWVYNVKDA